MKKTTIYLDLEDDITAVIDKVQEADSSVVALVPPKRMSVLQSTVNLKLLAKASKDASKKIVIISKEPGLVALSGSVGLFMADDLNSRPYVPDSDTTSDVSELVIDYDSSSSSADDATDNEDPELEVDSSDDTKKSKKDKKKDSKASGSTLSGILNSAKLRIPNFDKFRLRLILIIVGVILLIVGWYFAFYVFPKATVIINAQTSRVPLDFEFTLDSKAEELDIKTSTVPSIVQSIKKTLSKDITATGSKNNGTKAGGNIEIRNCDYPSGFTVAAGTTFTGENGFKFTTDTSIFVPTFSGPASGCDPFDDGSTWGSGTVAVTANAVGDTYNVSPQGYSFNVGGSVLAIGSQMSGGTTKIVKVIAQKDVDNVVDELLAQADDDAVKTELTALFSTDTTIVETSFAKKDGEPSSSPKVGTESDTAKVSIVLSYSMKGAETKVLDELFDSIIADEIIDTELSVYQNGVEGATFKASGNTIRVKANGFVGPELDVELLKQEISGLRFSAATDLLEAKPSVKSVEIDLSPFWVFSLPKTDRIEITIEIAEHALQ